MSLGRAVPWSSWEEWRQTGLWLLSDAPGDVQQGLDRVRVRWRLPPDRHHAPCILHHARCRRRLPAACPRSCPSMAAFPCRWRPGAPAAACRWASTAPRAWWRRGCVIVRLWQRRPPAACCSSRRLWPARASCGCSMPWPSCAWSMVSPTRHSAGAWLPRWPAWPAKQVGGQVSAMLLPAVLDERLQPLAGHLAHLPTAPAAPAGLPRILVDLRHEATHNELPSLAALR